MTTAPNLPLAPPLERETDLEFLLLAEEILYELPSKKAIAQLSKLRTEGWQQSQLLALASKLDPSGFFEWNLTTYWDRSG